MAVKLWGPMLTGIAQGFGDYQQKQEDLTFQRQQRVNQLAAQQLANQSQEMQNQSQQNALTQDQASTGFLSGAAQDTYGQGQAARGLAQAAPQGQPISGAIAQPNPRRAGEALDATSVPQMTAST